MNRSVQLVIVFGMAGCLFLFFESEQSWSNGVAIGCYILLFLIIGIAILLENREPSKTIAWWLALFFLPIVGVLLYLYTGILSSRHSSFLKKRREVMRAFQEDVHQKDIRSHESDDETYGSLQKMVEGIAEAPYRRRVSESVLVNGDEAYDCILENIKKAKRYIHIEYFEFKPDEIGEKWANILQQKAEEGVEVRFIYDAVGSFSLTDQFLKKLERAGAKISPFLTVKKGLFSQKINYRNHRKIIVIDGEVGYMGGLNVGEEYLLHWRDTHIRLEGEAVFDLHRVFMEDWYFCSGESLLKSTYDEFAQQLPEEGTGGMQIIAGGPDRSQPVMQELYFKMITTARQRVWIATPYFVPTADIRRALRTAALSGVDVRILLPKSSDSQMVYWASFSFMEELLEAGVAIYQYEPSFMHHKIVIIDDDVASIGSANLDVRSFQLNFEVNALMYHREGVKDLQRNFQEDLKQSRVLEKDAFNRRPWRNRIRESVARLFTPIL